MSHSPTPKPRPSAGGVPAPITVWPAWLAQQPARSASLDPATGSTISSAVAGRLICTYTRPGGLVVALHNPLPVAEAADWFARKATLIITDRHQAEALDRRMQPRLTPTRRAAIRVLAVAPDRRAEVLETSPGTAAMIIARVPEDPRASIAIAAPSDLIEASAIALGIGGYLCVEVADVDAAGRYADHATGVIAAAQAAGLIYLQHLVSINDRLSEADPIPARHCGTATRHRRAHVDLYVFHKPGVINA